MGPRSGRRLRPLLRHHLRQGVRRQREGTHTRSGDRLTIVTAVGFVDLVGYTAQPPAWIPGPQSGSSGRSGADPRSSWPAADGWSKHIGDEIMFSAVDLARVCRIALALLGRFDEIDTAGG